MCILKPKNASRFGACGVALSIQQLAPEAWIKNVNLFRSCLSVWFKYIYILAFGKELRMCIIKRWLYKYKFYYENKMYAFIALGQMGALSMLIVCRTKTVLHEK